MKKHIHLQALSNKRAHQASKDACENSKEQNRFLQANMSLYRRTPLDHITNFQVSNGKAVDFVWGGMSLDEGSSQVIRLGSTQGYIISICSLALDILYVGEDVHLSLETISGTSHQDGSSMPNQIV